MRAFTILIVLVLETVSLAGLMIRDHGCAHLRQRNRTHNLQLVEALGITDLALWTEARYTRHPSQADHFTAFQNGPAGLDCFPAATWVCPPRSSDRPGVEPGDRK